MLRRFSLLLLLLFCSATYTQITESTNLKFSDISSIERDIDAQRSENAKRAQLIEELTKQVELPLPNEKNIRQEDLSEIRITLDRIQLDRNNIKVQLSKTKTQLTKVQEQCNALNSQQQKLANPLNQDTSDIKFALEEVNDNLKKCQAVATALNNYIAEQEAVLQLTQKQINLLRRQYQRYNDVFLVNASTAGPVQDSAISTEIEHLQQHRLDIINTYQDATKNPDDSLNKNILISIISKQIVLLNIIQDFSVIDIRLQELQFADFNNVSLEGIMLIQSELNGFSARLLDMQNQLDANMQYINSQYAVYSSRQSAIPAEVEKQHAELLSVQNNVQRNIKIANEIISLVKKTVDSQFTIQSKNYLKNRIDFRQTFQQFQSSTLESFRLFVGQYAVSFQTLASTLSNFTLPRWFWLFSLMIIIITITVWLSRITSRIHLRYSNLKRLDFSTRLLLFIFGMIKRNLPYLSLLVAVWSVVLLCQLSSPGLQLILSIPICMLFVIIPYSAVQELVGVQLLSDKHARRTSFTVTVIVAIGALLLMSVFLAQWVLTDISTINVFRWIFGVFSLFVLVPLWRGINHARLFLDEHYQEFYTYRILRLLLLAIPFAFAFFAISSVLGYLNLAWLIAYYFLITLLYLLIWIAFIGFCKDLSLSAKRYALTQTSDGVFWAQDIINPIHTLIRYLSLVAVIYALSYTFGWSGRTPVISEILRILRTPLFKGDESSQFTLLNLLIMGVLIYFIFRIAVWVKTICYRWVYAKISDTGIRNSFSVFSQYAAVTLGFLFSLRIIGIDLTAFAVFAGALGVGIGFGLQTIANNFISGLLILIERPLRNGDIISVGDYEGTVSRIGMRSLTMTTFDNESVILPNSDFVTSVFKNWTHGDQILRIVLYLDIDYRHNPNEVEQSFLRKLYDLAKQNVFFNQPPDFEPGVFAYDYSERGITYRVQFYIHLEQHRMFVSRHIVIQSLWDVCRENQYEIAYPKADIFFPEKTNPLPKTAAMLPQPMRKVLSED